MMFNQGYKKKEDAVVIFSLIMSNNGFNPANFTTKVQDVGYKQLTWIAEEEGQVFIITIGGSLRSPR